MSERLISAPELAKRLGCSRRHTERLRQADPAFPKPIYLGAAVRFREQDLNEFIARRAAEAAGRPAENGNADAAAT